MALFRDRRGFPRWSFIDSRSLPRPRRAKEDSAASAASAAEVPDDVVAAGQAVPDALFVPPVVAATPDGHESWAEERRQWFAAGDWPTEPSEQAVQAATRRGHRHSPADRSPGFPVDAPAEVRARHGRGFASTLRRRRKAGHGSSSHLVDIDLLAVDEAMSVAQSRDGVAGVVVWHAATGLALAESGAVTGAPLWHRVGRDVRSSLGHDVGAPGPYQLVGLADARVAVLLHAGVTGACLVLDQTAIADALTGVVPQLREDLAAASREL